MSREKAIESVLEFIHQHSEGLCPLCGAEDYPVKGNKRGYEEVSPDEAEEWNLDHYEDCPVKILAALEKPAPTGQALRLDSTLRLHSGQASSPQVGSGQAEAGEFTKDFRFQLSGKQQGSILNATIKMGYEAAAHIDRLEEALDIARGYVNNRNICARTTEGMLYDIDQALQGQKEK